MVAAGFTAPLTVTAIYHHDGWLGVRNLSLLTLAAILLAFLATGWIPLPGTRLPGPGVSVLVLPLVVLVAVMTRQRGVRLPTLLALGLLTAPIIALVRPRWWERLERRGLPLTRAVDGLFDVVGRALRPVELLARPAVRQGRLTDLGCRPGLLVGTSGCRPVGRVAAAPLGPDLGASGRGFRLDSADRGRSTG